MEREAWRSGELAQATGLTVRALRHYEALGLLAPSGRTAGGHRWYAGADVRRLHQIIALRSLGLSLKDIRTMLAEAPDRSPVDLLRRQVAAANERIASATALRGRLLRALGDLDRMVEPSTADLLRLIEETITMTRKFTREEFEALASKMARQAAAMTPDELAGARSRLEAVLAARSPEARARLLEARRQSFPDP